MQGQNHKTAEIQSVVAFHVPLKSFNVPSPPISLSLSLSFLFPTAGKKVTEDEVEEMLESDNPAVFTKDVSNREDGEGIKVFVETYEAVALAKPFIVM